MILRERRKKNNDGEKGEVEEENTPELKHLSHKRRHYEGREIKLNSGGRGGG